jgi:tetratricopeptide (TPR) repeat protein
MLLKENVIVECDRAINLLNTGRAPEAVQVFTEILMNDDTVSLAWNNRGLALMALGHPFDAVINIDRAIKEEPETAEYHLNRGAALYDCELIEKAITSFKRALELKPNLSVAHMNMGNALKFKGKVHDAIPYYRDAVKHDSNFVDGHLNLGFAELLAGNFKEGWEHFEWRWRSNQLVPRGLPLPDWDGSSLKGKTLLVYGEQGMGDTLHFCRYIPMIKERFGADRVLLEVRNPLTRLMQSLPGIDEVITYGDTVPVDGIDCMVAIMSLPRLFGTTLGTIPWNGPYFKAEPYRAALWRDQLKQLPPGLLVGICWAGQSRPGRPQADQIDKKRSTTLGSFAPLAKVPGVSWVSLQKGIPRDQVEKPPAGMTIGDWTDIIDDFYDTAALIECLDLVITVDTSVVHLAAGLGKPTWMLSRWDGCWRWMGNRSDSPWYPTLTQFVQPKPWVWEPVMDTIALALRKFVKEHATQKAA